MKIAFLIGLFPPKWTAGTETVTYNIAQHLVKRGHEVHVITSLDEGTDKKSTENGIYVHRIFWPNIRFIGMIAFSLKTLFIIKRIGAQILHIQGVSTGLGGFLAKKILKKPYVIWGQGDDVYSFWTFKLVQKPLSKMILNNANGVLALTEYMKTEMSKSTKKSIDVIPNGINLAMFENLQKGSTYQRLTKKEGQNTIIFVGRLHQVKGIKYLIEAMDLVRQKRRDTRLILVGDGPEKANLAQLVEDRKLERYVTFVGKVSNEKIPEYMIVSDIFVLPSLSEGFGIVILEAMASGLPVIATKVRGIPEIVKEGVNGLLVEPKSPRDLAEKISIFLDDDELKSTIAQNNKEEAKKYDLEHVVQKLENVYNACI